MDMAKLILTDSVPPPSVLQNTDQLASASDAKKIQAAKNFESVFINQLLSEMKDTIGQWGFEKDATFEQINGIFWLYLSRHIADNGGLGMWKDIYSSLNTSLQEQSTTGLDSKL